MVEKRQFHICFSRRHAMLLLEKDYAPIVFFTDIKGGFAFLARQIVLPTVEGDEIFLRSISVARVEGAELQAWYRDLIDTSFWSAGGASQHSVQAAASYVGSNGWGTGMFADGLRSYGWYLLSGLYSLGGNWKEN